MYNSNKQNAQRLEAKMLIYLNLIDTEENKSKFEQIYLMNCFINITSGFKETDKKEDKDNIFISYSSDEGYLTYSGLKSTNSNLYVDTEDAEVTKVMINLYKKEGGAAVLIKNKVDTTNNLSEDEKLRDSLIEENLSMYDISEERYQFLRDSIFNKEDGLVDYVDNRYSTLSSTEKLEKQIDILKYLNKNKQLIDVDGDFFSTEFKNMQISNFLIDENLDGDLTNKENIKILVQRVDDVSEEVDFNKNELVDFICQIINSNFSKDEKKSIIENADTDIRIKLTN